MSSITDYTSLFDAFEQSVALHPARPFLHAPASATSAYADSAVTYTYEESLWAVHKLAVAYEALAVTISDRVAVAFDSRLDVYLHLLALNALGASIVPLNTAASDAEILYVIEHSDCKLIVSANEHLERLNAITHELDNCHGIAGDNLAGSGEFCNSGQSILATEAALLYTSGTTGKPKGCMLSNEYFLAIGVWYVSLGGICAMDNSDRLMTALPPNHMNALTTSFTAMMLCGGCVIQLDRFHPRSWWQTAREENASIIHCLGVMVAMLLTFEEKKCDDFSGQIKFCFGPGSDPRHQAVFEKRFGFPLIEAWAMTESGAGGLTIADKEPRHVGERCIGKAADTMGFRIVDENDQDVLPGESGELLVRSKGDNPRHMFFSGYYKDEQATELGWQHGWWHTGDVVRQGPDDSLFFVDRRKNVIRRSGENIAAVEVEAVLLQLEEVDNCAICPVPDEIRGDEVFAFVVLAEDAAPSDEIAKLLFDHCLQHLTYFKAPGYIAFVDELPLTASQKVSRGELKNLARQYCDAGRFRDLRHLKKRQKG